jgi:phosphate transport system substrate-binding protein
MSVVPPSTPSGTADDIHEAIRIAQGARTKPKVAVAIVVIIALTVVTLGWLAGWFAPTAPIIKPATCAGQVQVRGAGSSTVTPVMQAWATVYNTSTCAKITYSTEISGLSELAAKSIDFTAVDAPLNSSQSAELGAGSLTLPVTLEATAVVYNVPGVLTGIHLTGGVLAAIYLGNITQWNSSAIQALNPSVALPSALPIKPIYCTGGCATTLVFTGYLARANETWNDTVGNSANPVWPTGTGASGSEAVAADVNATPGAIGYVELPVAQQAGLPWADLQNPNGTFVAPSAENTTAAAASANPTTISETGTPSNQSLVDEAGNTTYPMATESYVVVYEDVGVAYDGAVTANTAQWLGTYILWVSTAAQDRGVPLGYAPFPETIIVWNSDTIEKLLYYGLPVLSGGDADGGL